MTYTDEIERLGLVVAAAAQPLPIDDLRRAREVLAASTVYAIGSGGTLAAAELLSYAHQKATGRMSRTMTALQFMESRVQARDAVVAVFSARAKHPDTANVIRHAFSMSLPVLLVTARAREDLPEEISSRTATVLTVPTIGAEGFLATGSLASMAMSVGQLYEINPEPLAFANTDRERLRPRLLVLHSAAGGAAATDIETRMHELGVGDVQSTDYRNFAHGRHVGLGRRLASTTVIALVEPSASALSRKTIAVLPSGTDLRIIETPSVGLAGAIDLLLGVMPLPLDVADPVPDPARPSVAAFGRRLYHLPYRKTLGLANTGVVERKVAASGLPVEDPRALELYSSYFRQWRDVVRRTNVDAVVLDWDGTCVSTADRWQSPVRPVQDALVKLIDLGLPLVFASGRGDSLYRDLRSWLPEPAWSSVVLELHNGAWRQELGADLAVDGVRLEWPTALVSLLEALQDGRYVQLRTGDAQMSVRPTSMRMSVQELAELVLSALEPRTDFTVRTSAHSVDIVAAATAGKDRALARASEKWGNVLAIGDQGQFGGNDYDLLHSGPLSVSVDRCSGAPHMCWPADATLSGPHALPAVLGRLSRSGSRVRLLA